MGAVSRSGLKLSSIRHLFIARSHLDHFWGAPPLTVQILSQSKRNLYCGPLTVYACPGVLEKLEALLRIMLKTSYLKRLSGLLILQKLEDGQEAQFDGLLLKAFDTGSDHERQFGHELALPDGKRVCCLGDEPFHECCRPCRINRSTAADAAGAAQRLGVKNLVLHHTEDDHLQNRAALYTAEAKELFAGQIFVPCDLETPGS